MSTIDRDEVVRVAALARIALTEEEIDQFAGQLEQIASAVATVSQAVGPDTKATSHPIEMTNVLRPDVAVSYTHLNGTQTIGKCLRIQVFNKRSAYPSVP